MSPNGDAIVAIGCNGAFHLWRKEIIPQKSVSNDENGVVSEELKESDDLIPAEGREKWIPDYTVSGHFGPVMDLSWDDESGYLISISSDATCRVWAHWSHPHPDKSISRKGASKYYEISRPLVHGHQLTSLSILGRTTPHRIGD